MTFTNGKSAAPCYVALRTCDGEDYIDSSTFSCIPEESAQKAYEFNRKYPDLAKVHRFVSVIAVNVSLAV